MKQVEGIWLPDGDEHFEFHLKRGERFEGAGTYQKVKIDAAIAACPINRRQVAVDVGAHVGLWSRVLARSFESVLAYEPIPENADCFEANLEGYDNVYLRRSALSSTPSDKFGMTLGGENSGNSRAGSIGAQHVVAASRLDDGCKGWKVDLIKVDVEGWEIEVIRGGEKAIRAKKPVIVIEQKPGHAERYGYERFGALHLLEAWGMVKLWERSGDYCLGWPK